MWFGLTTTIPPPEPFLTSVHFWLAFSWSSHGSTVGYSEGYLWNCRFYGKCLVRVAPDGTIDRVIEMPVQNVTTCTFGGTDLKTLFVTSASALAPSGDRLAGSLFSLQTDVKGQPENGFRLPHNFRSQ